MKNPLLVTTPIKVKTEAKRCEFTKRGGLLIFFFVSILWLLFVLFGWYAISLIFSCFSTSGNALMVCTMSKMEQKTLKEAATLSFT